LEPEYRLVTLPEVLRNVTAPPLFGPSRFSSLIRCPLKEIHGLPEEDMLAPSPFAILGNVIHEVMKQVRAVRAQRGERILDFVDDLFEEEIRRKEECLSENPRTNRLVPIRKAVGKTEYRKRRARLRTWAKTLSDNDRSHPSAKSSNGLDAPLKPEDEPADTTRIPVGAEQPIRVSSLRLSGRPDLIERDEDGTYHVTDFKTGAILDRDEEPREDYALQLRLYALMLQNIDKNARLQLWLEGGERIEVAWDEGHAEETMEQLLFVTDQLPTGRALSAVELAKAGSHCGSCRIRHRCFRYRNVAPTWWTEKSSR
jgi:CRISPR/Cas system-associated exonuclease Cas4 (RecB family)